MKIKTNTKKRQIKLGDLVESIASPIAKTIDKIAGTNLQECSACKKRKEFLNQFLTTKP